MSSSSPPKPQFCFDCDVELAIHLGAFSSWAVAAESPTSLVSNRRQVLVCPDCDCIRHEQKQVKSVLPRLQRNRPVSPIRHHRLSYESIYIEKSVASSKLVLADPPKGRLSVSPSDERPSQHTMPRRDAKNGESKTPPSGKTRMRQRSTNIDEAIKMSKRQADQTSRHQQERLADDSNDSSFFKSRASIHDFAPSKASRQSTRIVPTAIPKFPIEWTHIGAPAPVKPPHNSCGDRRGDRLLQRLHERRSDRDRPVRSLSANHTRSHGVELEINTTNTIKKRLDNIVVDEKASCATRRRLIGTACEDNEFASEANSSKTDSGYLEDDSTRSLNEAFKMLYREDTEGGTSDEENTRFPSCSNILMSIEAPTEFQSRLREIAMLERLSIADEKEHGWSNSHDTVRALWSDTNIC